MQNLVVLMEPSEHAHLTPLKTGHMLLNRFCIDENAAFELSGVKYLKKSSTDISYKRTFESEPKKEAKRKEYSF